MCIWSGRNQIPWLCRAARKQIVDGRGKIVEHGHFYRHAGRGRQTGSGKDQCAFAAVSLPQPSSASETIFFTGAIFWLIRSEEHTSELQSLMRISYAVFCLKKKKLT